MADRVWREKQGVMKAGEIADYLGVSTSTFHSWRADGTFDVTPVRAPGFPGPMRLWRRADVEAWALARRV